MAALQARGALRIPADQIVRRITGQGATRNLDHYVLRLTGRSDQRPGDAGTQTGRMAARRALIGGWDAWQAAGLPIEKKPGLDV